MSSGSSSSGRSRGVQDAARRDRHDHVRIAPLALDVGIGDHAGAAHPIVVQERLGEGLLLGEQIGDATHEEIGAAAGGRLRDELDRP